MTNLSGIFEGKGFLYITNITNTPDKTVKVLTDIKVIISQLSERNYLIKTLIKDNNSLDTFSASALIKMIKH
jgi:hypothetical protein